MELIQLLRRDTEHDHQVLERSLVRKLKAIRTLDEYVDLLRLMNGFYRAMESQLQRYLLSDPHLDFKSRRKSDWLVTDMKIFGVTDQEYDGPSLAEIDSFASALGSMYVLEGSTLGGQIIAKMLRQQLGTETDEGFSFFVSYGAETQAMWERFKEYLSRPFADNERREIVRGAKDTFTSFRRWIEQHELERTSK